MSADSKTIFVGLRRLAIGGLLTWRILFAQSAQLTITTVPPLPPGIVAVPYSQTIIATGGIAPYRWTVFGALPPGLQLDPNSGTLSGTPGTPGTFNFTIEV